MEDAVLLNLFGEEVQHHGLTHNALPKLDIVLLAPAPKHAAHGTVIFHLTVFRRRQQGRVEPHPVLALVLEYCTQQQVHFFLSVHERGRRLAVVAIHGARPIHLVEFLAEIVQQKFAAACGCLCIGHDLLQQLHAHFLFCNGFALQELLELVDVLVAVKCNATPFSPISPCTACLLVIAFKGLGHVVVNDKPNIRLVNAHAKGDGRHNHIHILHEELVLNLASLPTVHACVVSQRLHAIDAQCFSNLLHLLSAQTIHNATLAHILKAVAHDLLQGVLFGAHLVKQVVSVERGLEHHGIDHAQVLLNVLLHLGRGCRRQRHDGHIRNALDDGFDSAVFRSEVVAPL